MGSNVQSLERSIVKIFETAGGTSYAARETILRHLSEADRTLIISYLRWASSTKARSLGLSDYENMKDRLDPEIMRQLDIYGSRCNYSGTVKLSECDDWKFSGMNVTTCSSCAACNRPIQFEYLAYSKKAGLMVPLGSSCAVRFFGGDADILALLEQGTSATIKDLGTAFAYGRASTKLLSSRSRYRFLLLGTNKKLAEACAAVFPRIDFELWANFIRQGFVIPLELRKELKANYVKALAKLFEDTGWAKQFGDLDYPEFNVKAHANAVLYSDYSGLPNGEIAKNAETSVNDFSRVLPFFDACKVTLIAEILDPHKYILNYNPLNLLYRICLAEHELNNISGDIKSAVKQITPFMLILDNLMCNTPAAIEGVDGSPNRLCLLYDKHAVMLWSALTNSSSLFAGMFVLRSSADVSKPVRYADIAIRLKDACQRNSVSTSALRSNVWDDVISDYTDDYTNSGIYAVAALETCIDRLITDLSTLSLDTVNKAKNRLDAVWAVYTNIPKTYSNKDVHKCVDSIVAPYGLKSEYTAYNSLNKFRVPYTYAVGWSSPANVNRILEASRGKACFEPRNENEFTIGEASLSDFVVLDDISSIDTTSGVSRFNAVLRDPLAGKRTVRRYGGGNTLYEDADEPLEEIYDYVDDEEEILEDEYFEEPEDEIEGILEQAVEDVEEPEVEEPSQVGYSSSDALGVEGIETGIESNESNIEDTETDIEGIETDIEDGEMDIEGDEMDIEGDEIFFDEDEPEDEIIYEDPDEEIEMPDTSNRPDDFQSLQRMLGIIPSEEDEE